MRRWQTVQNLQRASRDRLVVIPAVLIGFLPHAVAAILYLFASPADIWADAIPWPRILLKGLLSAGAPVALLLVRLRSQVKQGDAAAFDWLGGGVLAFAFVWLGSLMQDLLVDSALHPLGRLLIPFGTAVWGGVGIGLMIAGTSYLSTELRNEHRERQRLEGLIDFVRQITSLDYQAVLDAAAGHLHALLGADACVLYLWDEENQVLVPVAQVHDMRAYTAEYVDRMMAFKCPPGFGLTGWVMQSGEPYLSGDVASDPRAQVMPGLQDRQKSSIVVPIQVEGRRLGVVRLTKKGIHQYSQEDLDLVQGFAGQAALVLEHARIVKELSTLSVTDSMTGLYNARHFHQVLEVEAKRAGRNHQPLSLIMTDSDSLKRVNDLLGHQQGDEHLRTIARVLRSATRVTDYVFRYAGDEFLVLLPNSGSEEALLVAERIRRNMEEQISVEGVQGTLSVGVATLPVHAKDGRQLMALADAAMYESKRAGKNRVTMATAAQPPA